jgi:hypothetical protein
LERLQKENDEIDLHHFCSFGRRWAKASPVPFTFHRRPGSLTSNFRNAANTVARSKRTQRGLILMNGIFFARCQLSMLLADTERAFASCLRFNSAGSFAADPGADTEPRCSDDFCFVSTHYLCAWQSRIRYVLAFFLRNEKSRNG